MTYDINLGNNLAGSGQGFKIFGEMAGDWNGFAVARCGDFNNDGYDDIIISSRLSDGNGRTDSGTAYIIFGKASGFNDIDLKNLPSSYGFKLTGAAADDWVYSVASAGDINGDGYDDIIIGSSGADPNSRNAAGISYVIFGKSNGFSDIDLASLNNTQGFKILGQSYSDVSGSSVAGAGDINNDGYKDIIIGAPATYSGKTGKSYIIFGKANGFTDIDLNNLSLDQGFKITGQYGDTCGLSVSAAEDINGDGFDDIIIGAPMYQLNKKGEVYVFYGKQTGFENINLYNSLSSSDGFRIIGEEIGDRLGISVASAGDINRDGYKDIIIGNRPNPSYMNGISTTYVIFGKADIAADIDLTNLTPSQGFKIYGETIGDEAGYSVASIGDINADGYDDIIIGAYNALDGTGKSYIILGKADGFVDINLVDLLSNQGFSITGAYSGDSSGFSVSGAGDINGDGYDDIIIGAPYANSYAGITYLIYGAESGFKTDSPTPIPTFSPTFVPSNNPTYAPTKSPSITPTLIPTSLPSIIPSVEPTLSPSASPTALPTSLPTKKYDHDCTKVIDSSDLALSPFDDKVILSTGRLFNIDCKGGNDEVVFYLNHSIRVDFFKELISVFDKTAAFKNCEIVKFNGQHHSEVILGNETIAVFGNNNTMIFHTDEENECIKLQGVTGHSFEFLSSAIELDLN